MAIQSSIVKIEIFIILVREDPFLKECEGQSPMSREGMNRMQFCITEGGIPFGITYAEMAEYEAHETGSEMPIFLNSHHDPVKAKSDYWFPESFDWENYFGEFPLTKDQEQLINELNKFDIQSPIRKKVKNK